MLILSNSSNIYPGINNTKNSFGQNKDIKNVLQLPYAVVNIVAVVMFTTPTAHGTLLLSNL